MRVLLAVALVAASPAVVSGDSLAWARDHLPMLRFAEGEPYFPVSFYFDGDLDVQDNVGAYDPGQRVQAYAHVNGDVTVAPPGAPAAVSYRVLQVWFYYVNNLGGPAPLRAYPDHLHDWDSVVQLWWDEAAPGQPRFARASAHGWLGPPVPWAALERQGTHVVVDIALGDHAAGFRGIVPGEAPPLTAGRVVLPDEMDLALVGGMEDSIEEQGVLFDRVKWTGEHPRWPFAKNWWPRHFSDGAGPGPWSRAVWDEPWRPSVFDEAPGSGP